MRELARRQAWPAAAVVFSIAAMTAMGFTLVPPKSSAAASSPVTSACLQDKACVAKTANAHRAYRLESWPSERAQPISARVQVAPPMLVELMNLENRRDGYVEQPTAARPDAQFLADLRAAIDALPPRVQQLASQRLIGIFLVDGLGSTGYTSVARDATGQPAGAFVVLDAGILARHTANEWASWRDSTVFRPETGWKITTHIEDDANDNRKGAMQYVVLHELGHVLSAGTRVHPSWMRPPAQAHGGGAYPFYDIGWRLDAATKTNVALPSHDFKQRTLVKYYTGAHLPASDMLPVYEALSQTGVPSLYAAIRPDDDFAESFVSYVHTVMMGRPWDVTIWRDGQAVFKLPACWGQPRCAQREALLSAWLSGQPFP